MQNGIPTVANERQFRSRLEATWYWFMVSLGWTVCYEPYDLKGWIPDFAIRGASREVLVECKPFYYLEEFAAAITKAFLAMGGTEKADKELLLLGTSPLREDQFYGSAIGWLGNDEVDQDERTKSFERAPLIVLPDGRWGFCHGSNSYHDRITDFYDGAVLCVDWAEVEKAWNRAASKAQWNSPNGRP